MYQKTVKYMANFMKTSNFRLKEGRSWENPMI